MTLRKYAAAASIALLAAPGAAQDVDPIFQRWNSAEAPGCAVAVARGGRTILSRAYGSADLEHDVPNRPETIFEAGSVAKQFTAAAILLLAEEGKLSLTDDVRKYVPELPLYSAPIRIDRLIDHTSGLRDWGVVSEIAGWPRGTRAATNNDVLDIASRQKSLNYPPGAEYSYTNTGYNLLAIIVERVSGASLADFTRDRLFKPLGMANTSWRDDFRRVVKGRAVAYERRGEAWAQNMPFENAYGNGGLLTTTADLLLWNEALTSGRLGSFLTAQLHRRAVLNDGRQIPYARGIVVGKHQGRDEIQHAGATGGYRAWLGRYPAEKLSVALLCNAGNAPAIDLGRQVAAQFLPPLPAPQSSATIAAGAAERAGLFVSERTGFPVVLVAEGERLRVKDGAFLEPIPGGRFRSPAGEMTFDGRDLFLVDTGDGEIVRYRRTPSASPTTAQLAPLAGRYVSEEAGAAYLVSVKDGKLLLRLERRPDVSVKLEPAYKDVFRTPGGIVRFYRNAKGRVTSLGVGLPRVRDLRFHRRS